MLPSLLYRRKKRAKYARKIAISSKIYRRNKRIKYARKSETRPTAFLRKNKPEHRHVTVNESVLLGPELVLATAPQARY